MSGEKVMDLGGIQRVTCQKQHPHEGPCEWTNGPQYLHRVTITWQLQAQPADA